MFRINKIDNGYLLVDEREGEYKETFYATNKKLIIGIREYLGMKKVGRPKQEKVEKSVEKVFNGLDEPPF